MVVERLFAWPGIGDLLLTAVGLRDYTLVQGITVLFVIGFLLINLLVEVLYRADQSEAAVIHCHCERSEAIPTVSAVDERAIVPFSRCHAVARFPVALHSSVARSPRTIRPRRTCSPCSIRRRRRIWLGTDEIGRDILSRVIVGTRVTLAIAVCLGALRRRLPASRSA